MGCVGKLDLAKPDPYNGRYGDRPRTFAWGFTHPCECEGKMHAGQGFRHPKGPLGPSTSTYRRKAFFRNSAMTTTLAKPSTGHTRGVGTPCWKRRTGRIATSGLRAAEWIRNIPDDFPWHDFVSFVGPHDPFDPPKEYAYCCARCAGAGSYRRQTRRPTEGLALPSAKTTPRLSPCTVRQYYAEIECLDDQIGLILDALEARGKMDNTYVIFTSDHGEMLGDHGSTRKARDQGSMAVPHRGRAGNRRRTSQRSIGRVDRR